MATTGSDLRQIPNNQEVFLFPHSDTALVLEILEMVEEGGAREDLWEAAKWVNVSPFISFYCSLKSSLYFNTCSVTRALTRGGLTGWLYGQIPLQLDRT